MNYWEKKNCFSLFNIIVKLSLYIIIVELSLEFNKYNKKKKKKSQKPSQVCLLASNISSVAKEDTTQSHMALLEILIYIYDTSCISLAGLL